MMGAVGVAAVVLVPRTAPAQQPDNSGSQAGGAEVVRGQVRDSTGAPIRGASVTVTGLVSLTKRSAHTDGSGRYSVLFGDGEGQYVVVARAIGYQPEGVRIERAPSSESPYLQANLVLPTAVSQLDSVVVTARSTPGSDSTDQIGGAQTDVTNGALFSLDPADLNALAARAPGVMGLAGADSSAGGFSVLGASPTQNSITVDGTTVISPELPPDAIARASLVQTTYDPSQGNFAGGQLSVATRGGSDWFEEHLHTTFADPHLAWADPAAPQPLAQNIGISGGLSGPIRRQRAYYNVAFSSTTTASPLFSLLSLTDAQRAQHGLSADTIQAVAAVLDSLGIPRTTSAIPSQATGLQRSLFARVDLVPTGTTSLQVNATASQSRQLGSGIGPMAFPSLGGGTSAHGTGLSLAASAYVHGLLNEVHAGVQSQSSAAGSFVALPHGVVRVGSAYAGGQSGLTQLDFGGGSSGTSTQRTTAWNASEQLSWISPSGHQRLNTGASITVTSSASNSVQDPFGTYTYQSLADLAANRPASYTRTLFSRALATRATASAFWVGGATHLRHDALRFQYGLRFDFSSVGSLPAYNAAVDSAFGLRTNRVPSAVGMSPRLGFSWRVRTTRATFDHPVPSVLTLSGGVGAFRGVIPASRIAGLANETGLPNAVQHLSCVGDATPTPAWQQYGQDSGAVPVQCLDGSAPATFSSSAPAVAAFDPSYQPPTSWRGNLQLNGLTLGSWPVSLNGTYSRGTHGESGIDLNLRRTPAFSLANEGGRPVYVTPDAIVPGSGAVAPGASRIDPAFASVTSYRSDLGSVAAQITVGVQPPRQFFGVLGVSLTYSWNYGRAQQRGFGGSTAGDPFTREWQTSPQPVHQIQASGSLGIPGFTLASLQLQLALTSGQRYTPMVVGDVNGDGYSDDRAFIFDPATTSDTSVARQMRELLASSTPSTRACLESQLGRIAGANSCATGWRLQPGIALNLNLPWQNMGMGALGDHLHLSIGTANAMGALLRLVGLEGSSLGQISGPSYPIDPALLYVDGFDPSTNQFRYRVNQQFGEGRPQRVRSTRFTGPFQVSLGGDLHFGGPPVVPLVQQLGLVPPGPHAAAPTLAAVHARLERLIASPVATLLRLRDSLYLNDQQIADFTAIQSTLQSEMDTALAPIARYVVAHGRKTDNKALGKRVVSAERAMHPLMLSALQRAVAELRPEQQRRLPPIFMALVARELHHKSR